MIPTTRRTMLAALTLPLVLPFLAGCARDWKLDNQDIAAENSIPDLNFTLVDAETEKPVTAKDFRGKVVMLYFGYTHCPNICPLTLSDTVHIFHTIGKPADDIRFLFVTVDPQRDTLPVLRKYIALFGSGNLVGLRGDPAELDAVAKRYHAGFSVHPSPNPADYTVVHSSGISVFNKQGKPEFIMAGMGVPDPHLDGMARDLRHLVQTDSA